MKTVECETCKQEMRDPETTSCTHQVIKIVGKWYLRNNRYFDEGERCHDCGIVNAFPNYHHPGCDMERCPVCGGQAIGCECNYDGEVGKVEPEDLEHYIKLGEVRV